MKLVEHSKTRYVGQKTSLLSGLKDQQTKAVEIWWNHSTRRPNQSTRKRYAPRSGEGSTSTSITIPDDAESDSTLSLDEWDSWFDN